MALCAFVLVKYVRKNNPSAKGSCNVEIITSLRLSARDIFLVIRCGPDVIAFVTGPHGSSLMGRWSYEEWSKSQ
ncbi:MAG: hypothetical protein IJG51_11960, partial [Synergistaceae bacterium]|nr:hypothetical protein [Synergistaceae bacterium]MBQ3759968.1 hypothetical protein [Synergistaceae bacterium]MBQ6666123.1 hypothetical protein [Synergistaceae bacterium]MBQ6982041.1 hypothetical protein [Synergistaceae bacterium]